VNEFFPHESEQYKRGPQQQQAARFGKGSDASTTDDKSSYWTIGSAIYQLKGAERKGRRRLSTAVQHWTKRVQDPAPRRRSESATLGSFIVEGKLLRQLASRH